MPPETSPRYRLASVLLGEDVAEFINARRPDRAWRLICRDIYEATHGEIDVTQQTVINWAEMPVSQAS